nr:MarR family transcriptional regulator [Micromonospora sp. DSM 115978]
VDDQPTTVSALAKRLDVSKQGAAQIVDDMERRGYLLRTPDPDDRRARLVALSPRGRQALDAARQFHAATEQRLTDSYGPGAVSTLRAILTDLAGGSDDGSDPQLRAMSI